MQPLNILTWHVPGRYLCYLAHARHHFFLPVRPGKKGRVDGYQGRSGNTHWPANLHEIPAEAVRNLPLHLILFQSHRNYLDDQYAILTPEQRKLPRIFLEHEPPSRATGDSRHSVNDAEILVVHTTHFSELMWDCGRAPTRVIPHGVAIPPEVVYRGDLPRGLVMLDGLAAGGRRLGADIFDRVRRTVPLDPVGAQSSLWGGPCEVHPSQLFHYASRYRFLFNPVRHATPGLPVCEAMMIGMPIVAVATTEMAATITNGVTGFVDTSIDRLLGHMRVLLDNPFEARRMGAAARRYAQQHFALDRFVADWENVIATVTGSSHPDGHSGLAGLPEQTLATSDADSSADKALAPTAMLEDEAMYSRFMQPK